MKVSRTTGQAFDLEFESEDELREEHRTNLSVGGLRLPTPDKLQVFSTLTVTLRGPRGAEASVKATVVAPLPDGVALAIEGKPDEILATLLAQPVQLGDVVPEEALKDPNLWERLRNMPRTEKAIFASKAERTERAILVQDNDPQVLFFLLKNPRLTIDEVIRLAKSPHLTYQIAELMMKNTQWFANLEVRVALIHNAKTPPAFAMRILPTLPESEVRVISRGAATSMALKQAALRRLQTGT